MQAVEDRLRVARVNVRAGEGIAALAAILSCGWPCRRWTPPGGYAFLVSVQLVERVVNYRRYVEMVLNGALPTSPSDSVEPLGISPAIK